MERAKTVWVLFLFLFSSLAGCLSGELPESTISLVVDAERENGTLVESYAEGEKISTTNVFIDFDFSQTSAENTIITYGIDTNDGRAPVTINADSDSIIEVEFLHHGIYAVSAFAIDEDNLLRNMTILIQIDLKIEWVESGTHEPQTLTYDPIPVNGGPYPKYVEISSLVENPSLLEDLGSGGQSVQVTWNIVDGQNDVCQKKTTQINDGDSDNWYTIHFNTLQVHELTITYDEGQDNINIDQTISIIYDS